MIKNINNFLKMNFNKFIKHFDKNDLIIFLIIFFGLMIWLLAFFPGVISEDSISQYKLAKGLQKLNDFHPIIHTLLLKLLYKIWDNYAVVSLFQIISFSFIWTFLCKITRRSVKTNFFQIIFTCIILSFPIVSLYSITLWKDILYTYTMLIFCGIIYSGIKKEFVFSKKELYFHALMLVLISKFRHNGLGVMTGLLFFEMLLLFLKKYKKNIITSFLSVFLIIFIAFSAPKYILNLDGLEISGVHNYFYIVGAYAKEDYIEDKDMKILSKIKNEKNWKNDYYPFCINSMYLNIDDKYLYSEKANEEVKSIAIKYIFKNPKIFIIHQLKATSIVWSIKPLPNSYTYIVSFDKNNNIGLVNESRNKIFNYVLTKYTTFQVYSQSSLLYIFYRPASSLYMSILLILILFLRKKKIHYFYILLPALLNSATLMIWCPAQDLRYVYINFLTLIFVILVFYNEMFKDKEAENIKRNISNMKKKKLKILTIIPSYNEEKSIEKTIDDLRKNNSNMDYIVINDGSKDFTQKVLEKNNYNHISLIHNLGIGGAVQTGYKYAKENGYDIAIQFDGDGQHNGKYIKELIKPILDEDYDLVIGSRFIGNLSKYKSTKSRRLGIKIISLFIKVFTKKKIYDTTSGFRACNKRIIDIFSENYPVEYPEPVSTVWLLKNNYTIKEIPVIMKERTEGNSSIKKWKSIYYMINVIFSIIVTAIRKNK